MNKPQPAGPNAWLFAEDLLSALQLRKQLHLRQQDRQEHASSQILIIYALDSEILEDYFYPLLERSAHRDDDVLLFRGDDANRAHIAELTTFSRRLSATLSRFLIDRICRHEPGILLPGHVREANDIYDAIVEELRKFPDTIDNVRHELEEALTVLRSGEVDDEGEGYPGLYSQGLWEKLNAFERPLFASNKFLDLLGDEHLIAADAVPASRHFQHLPPAPDGLHPFKFTPVKPDPLTRRFAERLHYETPLQEETDADTAAALDSLDANDRRALTRLFQINRRLGDSVRLVLVTPNRKLASVAAGIRDFPGNHSFADRYVRHPHSFLFDSGIFDHFSRKPASGPKLQLAWLDILLSSFDNDIADEDVDLYTDFEKSDLKPLLVRRAFDAQESNPEAHADFVNSWYRYLARAVDLGLASDQSTYESLAALAYAAEQDIDAPLKEFRQIIDARTEDSWRNFFETAARAGYQLIGDSPSSAEIIKRALPIAVFTHHLEADDTCQVLVNGLDLNQARAQLLDRISRLERVDWTGYTLTLAYSLLFAFSDRWEIAELLAQRAIKIYLRELERIPAGAPGQDFGLAADGRISGREAYYLSAAYSRVLSHTNQDFARVEDLLTKAEAALTREQSYERVAKIISAPSAKLTDIRFQSERISLRVSKLFVDLYCRPQDVERLTDDEVLQACDDVLQAATDCLVESARLSNEWLRGRIDLNLLTNIFMMAFVATSRGRASGFSESPERTLVWVERAFELNGGSTHWRTIGHMHDPDSAMPAAPSRLDRLACVFGISLWGQEQLGSSLPSLSFLEREVRLMEFLLKTHPRLILATPYDEDRYADVLRVTRDNLERILADLR